MRCTACCTTNPQQIVDLGLSGVRASDLAVPGSPTKTTNNYCTRQYRTIDSRRHRSQFPTKSLLCTHWSGRNRQFLWSIATQMRTSLIIITTSRFYSKFTRQVYKRNLFILMQRDFGRIVIHIPSATQNSPVYQILFLIIPWTGLHLTCL